MHELWDLWFPDGNIEFSEIVWRSKIDGQYVFYGLEDF